MELSKILKPMQWEDHEKTSVDDLVKLKCKNSFPMD